jgi:hypothetical protein
VKTLLLGLIVGLAFGYFWGYGEAAAGRPNVARRALNMFGVATVERTHRRMEAAIDSTGANR